MARRNKGNQKNRVSNVRVLDEFSGTDGARVDRMLSALQNSQSQTRIEIGDSLQLSPAVSGGDSLGTYSWRNVVLSDEFISLRQQWNEFRIRAIRFDVYDINPNVATFSVFSTVHEPSSFSTPPSYTFTQVVDGPDSQAPQAGGNRLRFTWVAKGPRELSFQNLDAAAEPLFDYGGLRFAIGNAANVSKYMVVVKALVDVRGRF